MSVEGSLDLFKLQEILQIVAQQRKTGILTVQGKGDIIAVSFLQGDVVGVDSLNQPGEEALSAVLEREGFLSPQQVTILKAQRSAGGAELQDLVVSEGLLTRYEVLAALRIQYQDLLKQLLTWREGEFKFYANDEVSFEEGLEPIGVQSLLLSMNLEDDFGGVEDSLAGPSPDSTVSLLERPAAEPVPADVDLSVVFERLPVTRPIKVRSATGEGGEPGDGFTWLTPTQQQLLSRVNGQRSLEELASDCALDWKTVVETMDSLRQLALVRPRPRIEARPRPPVAEARPRPPATVAGPRPAAETRPRPAKARPSRRPEPALLEGVFAPSSLDDTIAAPSADETVAVGLAEEPAPAGRRPAPRRRAELDRIFGGVSLVLASAGLLLLVLGLRSPASLLLPAPWQAKQRDAYEAARRHALYLKVDRAAKTYFLLNGRFPERLRNLVDGHQLARSDLKDPRGRPLRYEPGDLSYQLAPVEQGEPLVALGTEEAVTGNFLLDYDFFSAQSSAAEQPLVLLD